MPTHIPNSSNISTLTNYKRLVGTGMVPLLKPERIIGGKVVGNTVTVPPSIGNSVAQYTKYLNDLGTYTGQGSVLAVLDTGVFAGHDDFGGRVIKSVNVHNGNNPAAQLHDINDLHGHGTHVAGIAAGGKGKKGSGFQGVATKADIISVKVTSGDSNTTSWKRIADGLAWVLNYNNADVKEYEKISCVLICFNSFDKHVPATKSNFDNYRLFELFKLAKESNIAVVVSSGNHYLDFCQINTRNPRTVLASNNDLSAIDNIVEAQGLAFPAICESVISAGALAHDNGDYPVNRTGLPSTVDFNSGDMAIFSQRIRSRSNGAIPNPFFINLPGIYMISLDTKNAGEQIQRDYAQGYTVMSGTSQAAAVLAGMILVLQEAYRKKHHTSESCVPLDVLYGAIAQGAEHIDFSAAGSRRTLPASLGAMPTYMVFNFKKTLSHI